MDYFQKRVPSPLPSKLLILQDIRNNYETDYEPGWSDKWLAAPNCPERIPLQNLNISTARSISIRSARDHADRIRRNPTVSILDLICDVICVPMYFLDIFMDLWVAVYHYSTGNVLAFALVLGFTVLPSILLNFLSFIWFLEDRKRPHRGLTTYQFLFRSLACIFQFGPVIYYVDAFWYGLKYRRKRKGSAGVCIVAVNDVENSSVADVGFSRSSQEDKQELFLRMLEADRDATLLRMFEAFLEAAPQSMIQAHLFGHALLNHRNLLTWQSG